MKKITVRLQIIALLFISGVLTSCEAPENCDAASTSTCTDSSGSSPSESDSSPSVNNNSSIKTDGYIVEILSDDDGNYFAIGYSGGLEVSGSTIRTGPHGTTIMGQNDVFVSKYDSTNELKWTKLLGTSSQDSVSAATLSIDKSSIVLVGSANCSWSGEDSCLGIQRGYAAFFKISDGSLTKVHYFGPNNAVIVPPTGISQQHNTSVNEIAKDSSSYYVIGQSSADISGSGQSGYGDAFIAKFNASAVLDTKASGTAKNENPYKLRWNGGNLVFNVQSNSYSPTNYSLDQASFSDQLNSLSYSTGSTVSGSVASSVSQTTTQHRLYLRQATDTSSNLYEASINLGATTLTVTKKDSFGSTVWTKTIDTSTESPSPIR
ncbi:MAG TPA: hypothetical protein DCL41_06575, partial [Bdellovibrionales bacterium]|nr:hypothetical protein [Bdellovibrionales bacterium]